MFYTSIFFRLLDYIFILPLYLCLMFAIILLSIACVTEICLQWGRPFNRTAWRYKSILNRRELSQRLSQAMRIKCINHGSDDFEIDEFIKFHEFLCKTFPTIHSSPHVKLEIVNGLSLLYHVKGSDERLKPYMLCGHLDVAVPQEDQWKESPFGGKISDGCIWGKGAADGKSVVMGCLEALELLFRKGFVFHRSMYLAFGHDKISGGRNGARKIKNLLKSRNVKLDYILDEGGFVLKRNAVPGICVPIALVGVSQKTHLNLEISVNKSSEYTSEPPTDTGFHILSKALAKLDSDIFPAKLGVTEAKLFITLARYADLPFAMIYYHAWLFRELCFWLLDRTPLKYTYRTSSSVVNISNGKDDDPAVAAAEVYLGIHPKQTSTEVSNYLAQIINDDRVHLTQETNSEAPRPSPTNSFGWKLIEHSVQAVLGISCVAPITTTVNSDAKWYKDLSNAIYYFNIAEWNDARVHGINEKITVDNYEQVVQFYIELIKSSD